MFKTTSNNTTYTTTTSISVTTTTPTPKTTTIAITISANSYFISGINQNCSLEYLAKCVSFKSLQVSVTT